MKKFRKKLRTVLGSTLLLVITVGLGASLYIGSEVVEGSTQLVTNEETKGVGEHFWEKYHMNEEIFKKKYCIEELEIKSSLDGHNIPADYIYADGVSDKAHQTVILVHGLGGNRYSNYPVAEYFLQQGFNVITYDQRSSGENTASRTTFGYWESHDLEDYIAYVKEEADDNVVGAWGTSIGGATVGLALGDKVYGDQLDFAILDCPVSSMAYMIRTKLEEMNTGLSTDYMLFWGDVVNKWRLHFEYENVNVVSAVSKTQVPVLIFNSEKDEVTPTFMGKMIYDALPSDKKEIETVSDSKHTDIWLDHNAMYKEKMSAFIEHYGSSQK